MRILGIDPGTATTGFGVVESDKGKLAFVEAGVIKTPAEAPMPERLAMLHDELTQLLGEVKPDRAAVELLYFATNVTTAMTVGQARGVAVLALQQAKVPIVEFTPLQVKQAITGYGRADKRQIQEMVRLLLKLDAIPRPDDAADGLAIAIAAAQTGTGAEALGSNF